jgi:G3E family GTPase
MASFVSKIPTTIFSGFLGSGKTTIILHLIEHLQKEGQQVVYVKNEIGDLNVDSQIVQGRNIQTKELLNGCICCTLVGPFMAAVNEIADTYQPDRIIIEASGAADPSAIAMMVSSHPRLFRDGVISIIDVVNFEGYKDLSTTAQRQTEFTDLIAFNKIELVDLARKQAVVGYVRELNGHSPIIEAPEGKLDPNVVFGLNTKELTALLDEESARSKDGHIHSDHLQQDRLQSFQCILQQPLQEQKLLDFMSQLPQNVFRVKGFVQLVNEKMKLINKVGQRTELTDPPTELGFRPTTVVFIGFNVEAAREQLTKQLQNCV